MLILHAQNASNSTCYKDLASLWFFGSMVLDLSYGPWDGEESAKGE